MFYPYMKGAFEKWEKTGKAPFVCNGCSLKK